MMRAITREVSPTIARCELHTLARVEIDAAKCAAEHRAYEAKLGGLGLAVTVLPAEPDLPDSVFVEDPALVLDEIAIVTRMGAESRRREGESLAAALQPFRALRRMQAPATLEGGDVMRIGRTLFVGASARTNAEGIGQLRELTAEFGYTVTPVEVRHCLHLKSAVTWLGGNTLVANEELIDMAPLAAFEAIPVDAAEPWAANTLTVGGVTLIAACYARTAERLQQRGYPVCPMDISELMKAEAGLTCSSLIFEADA